MATKISYTSAGRSPRYGVISQPKQPTYTTLAQPASQPINPLYRAMAAAAGPTNPPVGAQPFGPTLPPHIPTDLVSGSGAPTSPKIAPSVGSTGKTPAGGTTFDLTSDPILAQIKALGDLSVGDAETQALSAKKQALIRFGDPSLATTLLGDTNTATAAGQNPDSTLAQLLLAHRQREQGIDQASNANNTYYGSVHANQLGDEARQYELDRANSQNALYDLLSGADQGVLSAKQHAQDQYEAELAQAYGRFLSQPPPTGDGTDGTGDGSGGGTDTGTDTTSGAGGLTGSANTAGSAALFQLLQRQRAAAAARGGGGGGTRVA